jgi:hypothetical protein
MKNKNRINPKELREYLATYAPAHAHMSVMGRLFPEKVELKRKAKHAVPSRVGGGEG